MSTYRKRAYSKPTTAAGLRAQASANGSSIFGNRPRNVGVLFGTNQSTYTNLLGISQNSYTPSIFNKSSSKNYYQNSYTNNNSNKNYPSSYTTYGGTASGYGALTLPTHSSISSLNLAIPSSSYNNNSNNNYTNRNKTRRSIDKSDSFNNNRSKPKIDRVNFGSRSSSLQSLAGSEGYASGNERSGRSSRLGSISSEAPSTPTRTKSISSENGDLDYKKLWEESQAENERLKDKLRRSDEQLKETKNQLEKSQNNQNKNLLSEAEKRERRAMERKFSEMEEELQQLQKLKAENERLKAENRALTRVVSKLTNTTK